MCFLGSWGTSSSHTALQSGGLQLRSVPRSPSPFHGNEENRSKPTDTLLPLFQSALELAPSASQLEVEAVGWIVGRQSASEARRHRLVAQAGLSLAPALLVTCGGQMQSSSVAFPAPQSWCRLWEMLRWQGGVCGQPQHPAGHHPCPLNPAGHCHAGECCKTPADTHCRRCPHR